MQAAPGIVVEVGETFRIPAQELGELEHQESAGANPGFAGRCWRDWVGVAECGEGAGVAPRLVCDGAERQSFEEESNSEEFHEAAFRNSMMDPVRPLFDMPDHPGPTPQGEESLGEKWFCFRRCDTQFLQGLSE